MRSQSHDAGGVHRPSDRGRRRVVHGPGARDRHGSAGGLHRLYVDTIQPSQYRVGEIWEAGKISVATEHLATATNNCGATNRYAPLAWASSGGPKAMIACTPEEMHELAPDCSPICWGAMAGTSISTARRCRRAILSEPSRSVGPGSWGYRPLRSCIWAGCGARSRRSAGL